MTGINVHALLEFQLEISNLEANNFEVDKTRFIKKIKSAKKHDFVAWSTNFSSMSRNDYL